METPDTPEPAPPARGGPTPVDLMRGLLEGAPEGAAVFDIDLRYVAFNSVYERLAGDWLGVVPHLAEPLPPSTLAGIPTLAETLARALAGVSHISPVKTQTADGSRRLVSTAHPVRGADSSICGVLHLLTHEPLAAAHVDGPPSPTWLSLREALRVAEAEEQLAAGRESERVRLFFWDAAGGGSLWSGPLEEFAQLLPAAGPLPVPAGSERIHPDDAVRLATRLKQWRREGRRGACFTFRAVRGDGSNRRMEAWARLLPGEAPATARLIGVSVDVTDLAAAEERMRETVAAYGRLFDVTSDGIVVQALTTDGVGPVEHANLAFARLARRRVDEIVGRPMSGLMPADEAARFTADLASLPRQGNLVHEAAVQRGDGTVVPVEASSSLYDEEGRALVLSVVRDVSVRKQNEERLRLSEQRFRTLAESLPAIVWSGDANGMIDYYNASWASYTGISAQSGRGMDWTAAIHPDDRDRMTEVWLHSVRERQAYEFEGRVRRHDGVYRWFLNRGFPVIEADGRVSRWIGTSTDIHAIKEAEVALRERESWFGAIIDTIPHMVWTAGPDGQVQFQSRQLVEYVGGGGHGRVERALPWANLFHPDDVARARSMWRRMIERANVGSGEFRLRRGDGSWRWFLVAAAPLKDADGRVLRWIGTWTDIDQSKASEALLRESDRRKDEFLAVLSHELRNPLAPIRNGVSVLSRAPAGSPSWQRALEIIHRQSDQLTRLVDDLLDITRINRGKIRLQLARLDLVDVARRCVEDLRDDFQRRGVALTFLPPDAPIWVHGDAIRLSQTLGNLLQNAAKFTPAGGRAKLDIRAHDDCVSLSVTDTGVGIDPTLLTQLFEPFMQGDAGLDRSRGGLGLGLALVRSLVEMHGGHVQADSEGPGKGSCFTVTLPLAEHAGREAGRSRTAESPAGRHVLIVEDNADAAEVLKTLLEMDGHDAQVAATGPDGVDAARRLHPDVVLCDIGLPGMDGYAVARALSTDPSMESTRLYALSGYAAPEDVQRAHEAGFLGLIAKPASATQLAAAIMGGAPPGTPGT
jgi:PAS domain S-box-containing protein